MESYKCFRIGRSEPYDGEIIARDTLEREGIELTTYAYTFAETEACITKELAEKIAKHYKKKVSKLTDDDVTNYLLEVMHIDDEVDGYDHVFGMEW